MAVVAVSAEGAARRFAMCFLIGATIYGAVIWHLGQSDLDPGNGRLLSTRAMEPVYAAMAERSFYDMQTGRYLAQAFNNEDSENALKPFSPDYFSPSNVSKQVTK